MKKLILFFLVFSLVSIAFGQGKEKEPKKPNTDYLKTGVTGITEVGALFTRSGVFSFNQVIGGRKSQHFFGGLGVGIDVNKAGMIAPVTIDLRAYFLKKRITPFLNIAPGYGLIYSFTATNGIKSIVHSFISNFGLGVEYKIKKNIGISLNAGYRLTVLPVLLKGTTIGHSGFVKFGIVY